MHQHSIPIYLPCYKLLSMKNENALLTALWIDRRTDELTEGRTDERTDGQTDGWTDCPNLEIRGHIQRWKAITVVTFFCAEC